MVPPPPGAPTPPSGGRGKGKGKWIAIGSCVALALLVIIIGAAAGGSKKDTKEKASATGGTTVEPTTTAKPTTTTQAPTTTTTEPPTTTTTAPSQDFTGRGDDVIDATVEPADILVIHYTGGSNFVVKAANELLVNTIGSYDGTVLYAGNDPASSMEVTASGPWTISVKPVSGARTWAPVFGPLTGHGDDVVLIPDGVDSAMTVDITNTGQGNFAVWAWSDSNRDLLVNEIGNYSGGKRVASGTLVFEITSEGDWSIAPR